MLSSRQRCGGVVAAAKMLRDSGEAGKNWDPNMGDLRSYRIMWPSFLGGAPGRPPFRRWGLTDVGQPGPNRT